MDIPIHIWKQVHVDYLDKLYPEQSQLTDAQSMAYERGRRSVILELQRLVDKQVKQNKVVT